MKGRAFVCWRVFRRLFWDERFGGGGFSSRMSLSEPSMTDKQPRLCRSCAYWYSERMVTSHMGECCRYPPMVDGWSISKGDVWCGEFVNKLANEDESD